MEPRFRGRMPDARTLPSGATTPELPRQANCKSSAAEWGAQFVGQARNMHYVTTDAGLVGFNGYLINIESIDSARHIIASQKIINLPVPD